MEKNKRWYDKYPDFSNNLEKLKDLTKEKRDFILSKIKDLINELKPDLIDKHVMEFPMDLKRRWYDEDPYSWLIINSLKYANKSFLKKATNILKKYLE